MQNLCTVIFLLRTHALSLLRKENIQIQYQWNSLLNLQQMFNHILRNFINICESSGVNNLITRLIQIPFGFKRGTLFTVSLYNTIIKSALVKLSKSLFDDNVL